MEKIHTIGGLAPGRAFQVVCFKIGHGRNFKVACKLPHEGLWITWPLILNISRVNFVRAGGVMGTGISNEEEHYRQLINK